MAYRFWENKKSVVVFFFAFVLGSKIIKIYKQKKSTKNLQKKTMKKKIIFTLLILNNSLRLCS